MLSRQIILEKKILENVSAVGYGTGVSCVDFRHKELCLSTTGMGAGDSITVKVQASSSKDKPDFSAAATSSNKWEYVQIIAGEDGAILDGDIGVSFADSDDVRYFAVNKDGASYMNVQVTVISDATTSVSADLNMYND